jgi:diguanylate cyclase (GGDEF)-like protein
MRFELKAFGSKVGRRVFGSFVVAAAVPVIATVLLVASQVTATLTDMAQDRLELASRIQGNILLDRLQLADDALGQAGTALPVSGVAPFEQIEVLPVEADAGPEEPRAAAFSGLSETGSRSNLLVRGDGAAGEVLISRATAAGLVVGRVNPAFLWDTAEILPYGTDMCVFDPMTGQTLYCTDAVTAEMRELMSDSIRVTSDSAGAPALYERHMAGSWQLFLPSRFEAAQPWSIVIVQPRAIAMEPVADFVRILPPILAVCLIVTLLLSSVQIRRIMLPLRNLVSGTKRVAEREFSTRLAIAGRDEFSELAESFNEMTERLGEQFETITALAEVDRLILSSQSIDHVMEKVLDRIVALIPDYCVSVLLLDPDQADRGQLYSRLVGHDLETVVARISVSERTRLWMASVAAGSTMEPDWLREHIESLPLQTGAKTAIIVPIFRADILRGAVIAQLPDRDELPASEHVRLLELTSRLGVAISAADHESELFHRAHFDALTGLPNRQLCFDRLHQAIAQARREEHRLAVLFIDLDRFKTVNDSFGHTLGDELLKEVALRLGTAVRETDTVARLGGDEYVILLPHIHGMLEVEAMAEKVFHLLGRPYRIRDQEYTLSASIGATIFPDDATDAGELLRKADTAMYSAKDAGRSRVRFFEDEMDRIVKERLDLQQDLRSAFANREFRLVYQPQLDIETGDLICMEALIRWHHPARGAVSPGMFIPVLEDMGLIGEVDQWVRETAMADLSAWLREGLDLPRIAVNISSRELNRGLEEQVTGALKRFGLAGHNLEIELTEHSLIANFDEANRLLSDLRRHGIRIAIDDFGTGYSSLGYLQGLHFDVLKIDRGFVKSLPSQKAVAIVEAIVGVAHALGKEVIAEGIDSDERRVKLLELGCKVGQGYLFSVPIGAGDVIEWSRHLDETSVIEKLVARDDRRLAG